MPSKEEIAKSKMGDNSITRRKTVGACSVVLNEEEFTLHVEGGNRKRTETYNFLPQAVVQFTELRTEDMCVRWMVDGNVNGKAS